MFAGQTHRFVAANANFGGGARVVPALGGVTTDRSKALADFILAPSGNKMTDDLPLIIGLQEMTTLLKCKPPQIPVNFPEELVKHLTQSGQEVDEYYGQTVTTKWYPLKEKWQSRWDEGIEEMEQGMFTCAKNARLLAPWLEPPRDSIFKGRKIDLPLQEVVLEFRPQHPPCKGQFQGAYYRGNRDTEPRVATAHGVSLATDQSAQFIFLNVHLATLKAEDVGTRKLVPTDQQERTVRRPTPQAMSLRYLQLSVLRDFILKVAYQDLRLPVIVAGDFNASMEAPELQSFLEETSMNPVFDPDPVQCWRCGFPKPRVLLPSSYFTHPKSKAILARTAQEVAALVSGGMAGECPISANECCSKCQAPFFTHKRNFGLIDNLLYTDSGKVSNLKWRVSPAADLERVTRGIRLDTYFSDHLPLWCEFGLQSTMMS